MRQTIANIRSVENYACFKLFIVVSFRSGRHSNLFYLTVHNLKFKNTFVSTYAQLCDFIASRNEQKVEKKKFSFVSRRMIYDTRRWGDTRNSPDDVVITTTLLFSKDPSQRFLKFKRVRWNMFHLGCHDVLFRIRSVRI